MENMQLSKLITSNKNINCAVSTIINEYDIKAAHTTACYFIFGKEMYDSLMALPKSERNPEIGRMMKRDQTLYPKIEALLLKWMNMFLDVNNIKPQNFVETTRDSIMLINKKPNVTKFENGMVEFRNKDGEFTSLYRMNGKLILFDSMSYNIIIKGINSDHDVIKTSPFVNKYLLPLLSVVENAKSDGFAKTLKQLALYRRRYLTSDDIDIYRDLMQDNKFVTEINGEVFLSDTVIDEKTLAKIPNYKNFVMPVMRSVLSISK